MIAQISGFIKDSTYEITIKSYNDDGKNNCLEWICK